MVDKMFVLRSHPCREYLFPGLVGGTLGLNYIGLISPIVSAIQALYSDVLGLEQTVTDFAQSFTSNTITATNELCVSDGANDPSPICVTKAQLAALLASQGNSSDQSIPFRRSTEPREWVKPSRNRHAECGLDNAYDPADHHHQRRQSGRHSSRRQPR
jgi:hypothetical protein